MADSKAKRSGSDRALIALSEAYEVSYWSKKLKITPAKLKAAVKAVGHSAKKVEAYIAFQKHKATRPRTDCPQSGLRSPLLVEEIKGYTGATEGGSKDRWPFIQESGRLPRRGKEEKEEKSQEEISDLCNKRHYFPPTRRAPTVANISFADVHVMVAPR